MSKFSETLSYLIFENGMDGKSFANAIGVDPTCITRYLSDTREPSVKNLILIANYYHCSTDYLLGFEERQELTFKACENFAERLKYLLKYFGYTVQRLSNSTGIHVSSISAWKSGKRLPTLDNLKKLAKQFDCRVDFVLGRES